MKLRQGCRLWWLIVPVIALDRLTKLMALRLLAPGGVKKVISGLISWCYVENRGMAFGMAEGRGLVLIILTAIIMAGLLLYLLRHPKDPALLRAGLWLVIGGGLGNLYDRIVYSFVVDFIRLDFIDFPVFNVADIAVCAGAGFAILAVFMDEWRKKHG